MRRDLDNIDKKYNNGNPIIIFDGVCNMCNSFVNFIVKNDDKKFVFTSIESSAGKNILSSLGYDPDKIDTFIVISFLNNRIYEKSDAAIMVSKKLNFPYNLISYIRFLPKSVRDFMYNLISKNRYFLFGQKEKCDINDRSSIERDRFL